MKSIVTILFFLINFQLHSQSFYKYEKDKRFSFISGVGINNYYGELNDSHKFDFRNLNMSIGLQYPLTSSIEIRSEFMYYTIGGDDKNAPSVGGRRERNLSFRGNNFEYTVTSVFNLFQEHLSRTQQRKTNFYLLGGLGITHFNPKAEYEGEWYKLRPLKTEGVDYSPIALIIPVGMGIKYQIDMNTAFVAECTYRFSNTDYLDDVSNRYVDKSDANHPVTAILADRRPEAGFEPAPIGSPRGNPETNDGYIAINFKFIYKLGTPKPVKRIQDKWMY